MRSTSQWRRKKGEGILAAILLPALARAREAARRASCANNLKQWGLIFKMYSGESKGEKYPKTLTYYGPVVDCRLSSFPVTGEGLIIGGMPDFVAIYPEYYNDLSLAHCPSSGTQDRTHIENAQGDLLTTRLCDEASQSEIVCGGSGLGQPPIKLGFTDYAYIGYTIEMADQDDPQFDFSTWEVAYGDAGGTVIGPAQLGALYTQLSVDVDAAAGQPWLIPPIYDADVGLDSWMNGYILAIDPKTGQSYNGNLGNGDSNTIYRLREGIERFMITDINNPGASAMAQSEIALQWDEVGTNLSAFNHVPGGSNVVFMDGHVEFFKYPSETFPVTKGYARLYGIFARLFWEAWGGDCGGSQFR